MASKRKREEAKKTFWQNRVLWLCAGLVFAFGALYYTQRGDSTLTPKPYEYNPSTNQYWDPGHKHWHDGPPPLTPSSTNRQLPANPATALPTSQTTTNTPKPYEYNPTTNQYWDPGHNHWHNGKPPSPESQKVLSTNPLPATDTVSHKPYEYNPIKNQYWDPNHKHWHNGKPPNKTLIPPISPGGK